jgi:hypothetical protein
MAATGLEPWDMGGKAGQFLAEQFGTETVNANATMARLALMLLRLDKQELIKSTRELRESCQKAGCPEEPAVLTERPEAARRYFNESVRLINTALSGFAVAEAAILQEEHAS